MGLDRHEENKHPREALYHKAKVAPTGLIACCFCHPGFRFAPPRADIGRSFGAIDQETATFKFASCQHDVAKLVA